jgi:hypothetical protein
VQLTVLLLSLLALVGLVHWYLWLRLVRGTTAPGRVRRFGTAAAVLLATLVPATLVGGRVLPPAVARWLSWPGYLWIGLLFYLLLGLLIIEPVRLAIAVGPRRTNGDGVAPTATLVATRRVLLARTGAAVVGAAAVGVVGYGVRTALGPPGITRLTVPLPRLPPGLDGLRIAVVADIHLGPVLGRRHAERIVRLINEQDADLVAIVGDLVDGTVEQLGEAAAPLRDLVNTHGSFFVTGNHEYYSGAAPWLRELARLGVHPLANERAEIRASGNSGVLDLAGVNDLTGANVRDGTSTGPDYDRALGGRDPGRPVVLLAHQPVQVHEAARRGVDLQLSGHTHGGQMFPFHAVVRARQPVLHGLHRFGDTRLFVTRGAGFWGPPVRVGAPPEIAIVRLATA